MSAHTESYATILHCFVLKSLCAASGRYDNTVYRSTSYVLQEVRRHHTIPHDSHHANMHPHRAPICKDSAEMLEAMCLTFPEVGPLLALPPRCQPNEPTLWMQSEREVDLESRDEFATAMARCTPSFKTAWRLTFRVAAVMCS